MSELPEDLHRALPDAAFEAIAVMDRGVIVWCNRAFEEMFGFPRDEVIGKNPLDLAPEDEHAKIAEAIRSGSVEPYEARGRRADGSLFHGELRARQVEIGGATYRVTTVRDLSQRHEDEERLRQSEARYRRLFEANADGLMVMGPDGFPREVNQRLCEMLGRTREEVLAMSPAEAIVDLAERPMRLERLATEPSYVVERQLRRADGGLVDVEVHLSAIRPGEVLAVIRDIGARKRAIAKEAELRDQLQHSQSLEAIGRLAGGVAHDFNNLLTVILASAEAMQRAGADAPRLGDIVDAARRAAELTEHLLTFSRHRPQRVQVVDARAQIAQLVPLLARLLGERFSLEADLDDAPLTVLADAGQLTQIVMNLVLNARDAMRGGGRIALSLGRDGDRVALDVLDEGGGIPDDVRERLFEPFFTTKGGGANAGLGLSIVYGIVTGYGGTVDAVPEGAGTRFRVRLPSATGAPASATPARRGDAVARRILFAEDDDAVRRVVRQMLEAAGHLVVEARGVEEALAIAEAGEVELDFVLTDVVMPDGSGVTLARRLAPRPSLLISGYPREELRDHPDLPLLAKPFSPGALLDAIAEACGSAEERRGEGA